MQVICFKQLYSVRIKALTNNALLALNNVIVIDLKPILP